MRSDLGFANNSAGGAFSKKVADTVVFMDAGRIVEKAPPAELFANPKSERTKTFLSQILAH